MENTWSYNLDLLVSQCHLVATTYLGIQLNYANNNNNNNNNNNTLDVYNDFDS